MTEAANFSNLLYILSWPVAFAIFTPVSFIKISEDLTFLRKHLELIPFRISNGPTVLPIVGISEAILDR